jgi:hypothetical protein
MNLFWSKRGAIACGAHAPAADSDRWREDGWQPVPHEHAPYSTKTFQCQFCYGRPFRTDEGADPHLIPA